MKVRLPDRLETRRLVLRHWTHDDAPALEEAITESLEHLRPWMPWAASEPLPIPDRLELFDEWHRQWRDGGDTILGIFKGGTIVGGTGLHRRDARDTLEIGYWVHVDHIGKGYASEAAQAVTDAAFEIAGVEEVAIRHDRANEASGRIPQRLGFNVKAEVEREPAAPAETGTDIRWSISRDEWRSRESAYHALR